MLLGERFSALVTLTVAGAEFLMESVTRRTSVTSPPEPAVYKPSAVTLPPEAFDANDHGSSGKAAVSHSLEHAGRIRLTGTR
jgi:hypothetical protein